MKILPRHAASGLCVLCGHFVDVGSACTSQRTDLVKASCCGALVREDRLAAHLERHRPQPKHDEAPYTRLDFVQEFDPDVVYLYDSKDKET